jgi:hypothetical protein
MCQLANRENSPDRLQTAHHILKRILTPEIKLSIFDSKILLYNTHRVGNLKVSTMIENKIAMPQKNSIGKTETH